MKHYFLLLLLMAFFAGGCAHSPDGNHAAGSPTLSFQSQPIMEVSAPANASLKYLVISTVSENKIGGEASEKIGTGKKGSNTDEGEEEGEEKETASIADPLEPFNRVMYQFNDKIYFWVLKPVAQGYSKIVPETGRSSVKNFFSNLGFPKRFVSCLLQADFSGAATELGRFAVNTIWGIGGLLDPASNKELNLQNQGTDLGQTLGVYGLGQGFYIVWPVLGPSSLRDSVEIPGEYFLYPVSYISPWYDAAAVGGYREVNDTSLRIGDYETLKEAAIDPYVAIRNAYVQYRWHKVKDRGKKEAPVPGGVRLGAGDSLMVIPTQ
jgi:phospholipid-binding lipoprotein MlaA